MYLIHMFQSNHTKLNARKDFKMLPYFWFLRSYPASTIFFLFQVAVSFEIEMDWVLGWIGGGMKFKWDDNRTTIHSYHQITIWNNGPYLNGYTLALVHIHQNIYRCGPPTTRTFPQNRLFACILLQVIPRWTIIIFILNTAPDASGTFGT